MAFGNLANEIRKVFSIYVPNLFLSVCTRWHLLLMYFLLDGVSHWVLKTKEGCRPRSVRLYEILPHSHLQSSHRVRSISGPKLKKSCDIYVCVYVIFHCKFAKINLATSRTQVQNIFLCLLGNNFQQNFQFGPQSYRCWTMSRTMRYTMEQFEIK